VNNGIIDSLAPPIGRAEELDVVTALIESNRLVTLVGPGGAGKTRLARAIASRLGDRFAEGVHFVDISPLGEPALVAPAIARLLRPGVPVDGTDADSLAQAIGRRSLLLIVDDCDRHADGVAKMLSTFFDRCPNLRMLATCREPLGIGGETVYRLPQLASANAIELFVRRARDVHPDFALTETNQSEIAALCAALDLNPLAIELVAARAGEFESSELARRMEGLSRQQVLYAAIDWSYGRLPNAERRALQSLSMFAGTFTLDTAADVSALDGSIDTSHEHLANLIRRAMVAYAGNGRCYLLDPIRHYAAERLAEGDEYDRSARRHAEAYARVADRAFDSVFDQTRAAWKAPLLPELENFRAALRWALDKRNDPELGARVIGSLCHLWRDAGIPVEGLRRAQQAAVQVEGNARLLLTIAAVKSALWMLPSDQLEAAQRAESLFENTSDTRGRTEALIRQGRAYAFMRKAEASKRALDKALRLADGIGNSRLRAQVAYEAAIAAAQLDDFAEARRLYDEIYPQFRADGEDRLSAVSLLNLAEVEFALGDPQRAVECMREASNFPQDVLDQGSLKSNLTAYLVALDRLEEARDVGRDALRVMRLSEDRVRIVFLTQHLAAAFALGGDPRRAARLHGYTEASYTAFEVELEYTERYTRDLLVEALHTQLGDEELSALVHEGSLFTGERAADEALRD
jgi:predicted ATPase